MVWHLTYATKSNVIVQPKNWILVLIFQIDFSLAWYFLRFCFKNNQKTNVDRQQGKDKLCSMPKRIKSSSWNLLGSWPLGVLDITFSSVIFTLYDEAELEIILPKTK